MDEFDEIDLKILKLLSENSRRSFSSIANIVGLSGPAISNRVKKLRDAGFIESFTIDIDRGQIHKGGSVLVQINADIGKISEYKNEIKKDNKVDHIFITGEGNILFHAYISDTKIHKWIQDTFKDFNGLDYNLTFIDEFEWNPKVGDKALNGNCAECGNTVDKEGSSTRLDGDMYYFCCSSCEEKFEKKYKEIKSDI